MTDILKEIFNSFEEASRIGQRLQVVADAAMRAEREADEPKSLRRPSNILCSEGEIRDGLHHGCYSNGLTLSINSTHGDEWVEVAVMHTSTGNFVPLGASDDVAHITMKELETLKETMVDLPANESEAARELHHWADRMKNSRYNREGAWVEPYDDRDQT